MFLIRVFQSTIIWRLWTVECKVVNICICCAMFKSGQGHGIQHLTLTQVQFLLLWRQNPCFFYLFNGQFYWLQFLLLYRQYPTASSATTTTRTSTTTKPMIQPVQKEYCQTVCIIPLEVVRKDVFLFRNLDREGGQSIWINRMKDTFFWRLPFKLKREAIL